MNQRKPLRHLLITSVILLVLLLGAYLLRTTLITRSVNVLLAAADVRVLLLGEIQLGWSELYVDQLVLGVGPDNTRQTLQDLRLGYSVFELQPRFLQAGRVVLAMPQQAGDANSKESPVLLSELLDMLFTLPLQSVEVGQLEVAGLSHHLFAQPLALKASVSERSISLQGRDQNKQLLLDIQRVQPNKFVLDATLSNDEKAVIHLALSLDKRQDIQTVAGEGELLVSAAFPLLKSALPMEGVLTEATGQVFYQFSGEIEDNLTKWGAVRGTFQLMPTTQLRVKLAGEGLNASLEFALPSPVRVSLQPNSAQPLNFLLAVDSASLQFKEEKYSLLGSVDLSDLQCSFLGAIQCRGELGVSVSAPHLDVPGEPARAVNDAQLNFSAQLLLNDNSLKAQIPAGQWLHAGSLVQDDLVLSSPALIGDSEGSFNFDIASGAMSLEVAALRLLVPQAEIPGLSMTTVLQFQKLELSAEEDGAFETSFHISSKTLDIEVPELWLPVLGLESDVLVTDKALRLNGSLRGDGDQALLQIEAAHDFTEQRGRGRLYSADLNFNAGEKRLSKYFSAWPFEWDVLAGSVDLDSSVHWQGIGPEMKFIANIEQNMKGVAGVYEDVGFVGLAANLALQFQSPGRLMTTETATISVDSVDVGVPIEAINAYFQFDSRDQTLSVDSAEAKLFGGRVWLEEMVYHADQAHNKLFVGVDGIQLDQLLQLAGYDAVQATGSISGLLPLDVNSDGATMERGMLAAKAPGGLFRYKAEVSSDVSPTVAPVLAALDNYHYDVFQLEADYLEGGDLQLAMIFRGSNPQLQQGRPIHLNLNVTDNIPALLKSLQSGRRIAETVEKKLGGG